MSPPTAAPSQGSGAGAAWAGSIKVEGSSAAAGGDDAPPELDALRPTFSSKEQQHQQAAQIPSRRRLPISLAPVGVRKGESTNSAPLPSLSSAMSSAQPAAGAGAVALPRGSPEGVKPAWGGSNASGEEWHQQQQQQQIPQQPQYSRQFAELARPRRNLGESAGSSPSRTAGDGEARSSPVPAAPSPCDKGDVGVRPKIEIDAGPSSPAAVAAARGAGGDAGIQIGPAAAAAAAARSSSSRAEGGSYHRSRKAYIQNRSLSSGGDGNAAVRISHGGGEEGVQQRRVVSRHARRFSSGGEFSNGTSTGSEFDRCGGDLTGDATNSRRSSAGGAGTARVQIRGGGIAITSLLSSEDTTESSTASSNHNNGEGGARLVRRGVHHDGSAVTTPGSASSAPPSTFSSYHRQESTASSVGGGAGDFTYTSLGSGASRASTPGGGEGPPGGRPPLVRKRSLTVAMDDGGPGGPAICPSPRGRRRSVDGVFDTKDGNPDGSGGGGGGGGTPAGLLESPSRPPRLMAVGNNGVTVVGGGGGSGGGGVGGGCFSPLISYPSPHGDRAGGREYALRSPAHDRLSVTVTGPMMTGSGSSTNINTAGTATPTTLASATSSASPVSGAAAAAGVSSSSSAIPETPSTTVNHNSSAMEVEWIPNENAHHAGGAILPAPSPVTSAGSMSSAPATNANAGAPPTSLGRRPPSPYPPSPGRDYRRGVVPQRGTPHSPSPRRAPPSPAQAPGSAGLRRRGTRRLSGGRSTPRGVRSRSGVGKGVYVGGGGGSSGAGAGSGEGSGTYESDYDSDLSEMSAYSNYSAMGSLERQLQQDTFFELDESLWRVVTRREVRAFALIGCGFVLRGVLLVICTFCTSDAKKRPFPGELW